MEQIWLFSSFDEIAVSVPVRIFIKAKGQMLYDSSHLVASEASLLLYYYDTIVLRTGTNTGITQCCMLCPSCPSRNSEKGERANGRTGKNLKILYFGKVLLLGCTVVPHKSEGMHFEDTSSRTPQKAFFRATQDVNPSSGRGK